MLQEKNVEKKYRGVFTVRGVDAIVVAMMLLKVKSGGYPIENI